jgi:hypothetical protein
MKDESVLEAVIAESPYKIIEGTFWMQKVSTEVEDKASLRKTPATWAAIFDGQERTIVVCSDEPPPNYTDKDYGPLRAVQLKVSRPFDAPGFLAAACTAVAQTGTPVLAISTFTFDYIFVRSNHLERAISGLNQRGFHQE